jgi:hypothetical protein
MLRHGRAKASIKELSYVATVEVGHGHREVAARLRTAVSSATGQNAKNSTRANLVRFTALTAGQRDKAQQLAEIEEYDLDILDINLQGLNVEPVAEARNRG